MRKKKGHAYKVIVHTRTHAHAHTHTHTFMSRYTLDGVRLPTVHFGERLTFILRLSFLTLKCSLLYKIIVIADDRFL